MELCAYSCALNLDVQLLQLRADWYLGIHVAVANLWKLKVDTSTFRNKIVKEIPKREKSTLRKLGCSGTEYRYYLFLSLWKNPVELAAFGRGAFKHIRIVWESLLYGSYYYIP